MNILSRRLKGQTMVLVIAAIPALIAALALCTDVLVMYFNWEILQKAADAAALAGAGEIPNVLNPAPPTPSAQSGCPSSPPEKTAACNFALANSALASETTVAFPAPNPPAQVPAGFAGQTVQVSISRPNVPALFGQIVGLSFYPIKVTAIAVGPTPVRTVHNGLFPAGMPSNPNGAAIKYGQEISIIGGNGEAGTITPGNWGWLNIPNGYDPAAGSSGSGGGAQQLYTNISNGCACTISVGDPIGTKPGESWGPTKSAVDSLNPNNDTLPNTLTGSETELVTIPVVDWSGAAGGATSVKVVGFAQAWIDGISKRGSNQVLTVQFVKFLSRYAVAGGAPNDFGAELPPYLVQ